MATREELIKQCRYYKGESESPFEKELLKHEINKDHLPPPESMHTEYEGLSPEEEGKLRDSHWFWMYEEYWVKLHHNQEDTIKELEEEGRDLLQEGLIAKDNTPLSLKTMFFNRYTHCGGSPEGFIALYARY